MLDLKKLEEKLNKALANETSESLTNWLQEKRLRNFLQSMGEGKLENISQTVTNRVVMGTGLFTFDVEYFDILYPPEYLIAA